MALHEVDVARGPLAGRIRVPPSKSMQQRGIALACLAEGTSTIVAEGDPAGDVVAFAAAAGAITGREVFPAGEIEGRFHAAGLGDSRASVAVDLMRNATGLRLATVLSALRPKGARTLLRGDRRLLARPHGPLLRALERLGAVAHRRHSGAIRVVAAPLARRPISIAAAESSQFATALLVGAPRMGGLTLRLVGDPVSRGYLDLTLDAAAAFSVRARVEGDTVFVEADPPRATRFVVEPDASSAAVWWAAAALVGGRVVVPGLPRATRQPDAALLPVLARMGARVTSSPAGEAIVEGTGERLLGAGDVDVRSCPDLAPLVAALAAGADGETRVVHAPHLRLKESDRIASCVAAVRAIGGGATEAADGFVVKGTVLRGGVVEVAGDHRLALAFGVLGLRVKGVLLAGAEAVSKSYPGFLDELRARAKGPGA